MATLQKSENMKRATFILVSFLALHCTAQTEVNSFSAGRNEGVTYALPDTKIEISVETTCIVRTPGEFGRYADRYLRIDNAITESENSWTLGEISVKGKGIPNPDKMFTIKLNSSTASNITIGDNGVIESINCEPINDEEAGKKGIDTRGYRTDASQYLTGEMLQATSTAKMAELAAKEIYAIRESKIAMTRGTAENAPTDGAGLQLILEELNKQEDALTELFTGRTDTITHFFTLELTPQPEACDTTKAVLFRFSRKLGLLDKEDLAGEPVYYDLTDLRTVIPATAEKKKQLKKEGICYNVPGRARIEIYTRGRKLADEEIAVAQLGTTEILSKDLFKKNNNTEVQFDKSTGGIVNITRK